MKGQTLSLPKQYLTPSRSSVNTINLIYFELLCPCSDPPLQLYLEPKGFKWGSTGNRGELGKPGWPSDWIHSDGAGVHQVRVEEGPALRAIQPGPLYLIQAAVCPVHRSTKVVDGKSFGAYQTWNKTKAGLEQLQLWKVNLKQRALLTMFE